MNRVRPSPLGRDEERIAREASDWLTRHIARADEKSAEGFEAWIEADPRHLEAYERLSCVWDDMADLGHLRAFAEPDRPFSNLAGLPDRIGAALIRPRAFAGAVTALAALALAAPYLPGLVPAPAPQFATAIAEIEPVRLEDGSIVTLGARSGVDVDFSGQERSVTLREGQAFFEVARNPERPFIVRAGEVYVRVLGTRFEIRRGAGETVIAVQEGLVEADLDGRRRQLRAGERLVIARSPALFASASVSPILNVQPTHVAAWREGRLSYDDARLEEVVADLNRYYRPGVELADARTGAVRVTASFRADEIEAFLSDLSRAFPVRVSAAADGRYRLSSPSS